MTNETTPLTAPSVFHRMKTVASLALLGAVLAGMTTVIPGIAALAPIADFHAVGAVLGAAAGIAQAALRR